MARKNGLSVTQILLNSGEYKALLQDGSIGAELETVDLSGIGDRYAFNQAMAAANSMDFSVLMLKASSTLKATNLDVSLYSIGGTDIIADVDTCQIQITAPTEDAQGLNVFDKVPNLVGKQEVQLTTKKMISVDTGLADFTGLVFNGSVASLVVAVDIIINGIHTTFPATLSAAKHSFAAGKLQLEDVTIKNQGAPTAPASSTGLVGKCLLGDATCTVDVITGANEYIGDGSTGAKPLALITKISVDVARGQAVKIAGTLMFQGSPTVS